ncbi:MAG TPA: preprotein translocase subunit SecE [Verrucomicrobiae bacterium]
MNNWIQIVIGAAIILAVFGVLWWQGQIQRLAVYVAETREELKKCNWPTWEELKGSTALIIVMIALLGGFVMIVDLLLTKTFNQPLVELVAVAVIGTLAALFYKSSR